MAHLLDSPFWQVQAGPFGTRTGVLSTVSSEGYDDLERVTLLQGRRPLGKEPVSFQNSGWQSREGLSYNKSIFLTV